MDNISKWVEENYGFPGKVRVKPLRTYTNDVFEIKNGGKHLLKIYGDGWRTESEILWEIDLLEHLTKHHVAVAEVVEGKRGIKLFNIDKEKRPAVMYKWAAGKKPVSPFTLDDYERLGKAVAKIHKSSDNFESKHSRQPLDLEYLLHQPLKIILNTGYSRGAYFQDLSKKLHSYVRTFESLGLDWGVVHGDVTFDNVHIVEDKTIVFYDFDSGGQGWRAIDLQGWAMFDQSTAPRQTAFLKGFRSEREISDNDVNASPFFHAANEFWGVGLDLSRRINKQGDKAIAKYLDEKINEFDKFLKYFDSRL